MKYYKNVENGYIISISTGAGQIEITQQEYNEISDVVSKMPVAQQGYTYKLKEDLTWETHEITEENNTSVSESEGDD